MNRISNNRIWRRISFFSYPESRTKRDLEVRFFGFIVLVLAMTLQISGFRYLPSPVGGAAEPVVQVPTPPCGRVLFPSTAAGSWLVPGGGVNVFSNGPTHEGTGVDCVSVPNDRSSVGNVLAGYKWQCPELVNRFYLSRGWIHSTWSGDAGLPMWNNTPHSLAKQANGAVSFLGPGDVVIINVYHNGTADGGHAFIANIASKVVSGTVNLVSQNSGYLETATPVTTGSLSKGNLLISGGGNGWSYRAIGVVHAPVATAKSAWVSTPAPLPAGARGGELLSVVCPPAGACAAVGYTTAGGWLLSRRGSAWTAITAPAPAGARSSSVSLNAVACARAKMCVAVGSYTDNTGRGQGILATGSGPSWTAARAPLPPGAASDPDVDLLAVACGSAQGCLATGYYTDSAGYEQAVLLTFSGSSWKAAKAPVPADAFPSPSTLLFAAACPSTCVAVGAYDAPSGQHGLIESPQGLSWTAIKAPTPSGAGHQSALLAITCPTATNCLAAGQDETNGRPLLLTMNQSSWTAAEAPLPPGSTGHDVLQMRSAACLSANSCVAVGGYYDRKGNYNGLLVDKQGSSWISVKAPLPPGAATAQGDPGAQLNTAACPQAPSCFALGQYTDSAGNTQLFQVVGQGSKWTANAIGQPANATPVPSQTQGALIPPFLTSTACTAGSPCVSVGAYPTKKQMEGLIATKPTQLP